jgi:hypothetical protein
MVSKQTAKASKRSMKEESEEHEEEQVDEKVKKVNKSSKKDTSNKSAKHESHSSKVVVEEGNAEEDSPLKFDPQLTVIQEEIKSIREKFQTLNSNLKKLESAYRYDIKKVRKHKQKRNGPHTPTGFAKPQPVPDKLAKFIGVKSGTELTGPTITSKVWTQLKERGLTYEKDKRVFRTDKEVSELFNVPSSVNKSQDHRDKKGFNFCNLQTYIANALNAGKPKAEKTKEK